MNRREFGAAAVTMAAPAFASARSPEVPEVIRQLRPMKDGIQPITEQERNARIEKARRLMRENQIDAVFLEC
jgi:Xaa-Pro dipeptidase